MRFSKTSSEIKSECCTQKPTRFFFISVWKTWPTKLTRVLIFKTLSISAK